MGKLVIDGNSVYEIDEECLRRKENQEKRKKEIWEEHNEKDHIQNKKNYSNFL